MFEVQISESLYEATARAAKSQKVSIEHFVAQALQTHLRSALDIAAQSMFTPERLEQIAIAKADIDAGNYLSLEELDAQLAANKADWMASQAH